MKSSRPLSERNKNRKSPRSTLNSKGSALGDFASNVDDDYASERKALWDIEQEYFKSTGNGPRGSGGLFNDDTYVYVLLDDRKKGDYSYGNWKFDAEPFYVGKGSLNRVKLSRLAIEPEHNSFKSSLKKKILQETGKNPRARYFKFPTNRCALEMEKLLIELIGRRVLGKGPLVNLTDGGEGVIGYAYSDEQKAANAKRKRDFYRRETKAEKSARILKVIQAQRKSKNFVVGNEAFSKRLEEVRPGTTLLSNFVSVTATKRVSVELKCGHVAIVPPWIVLNPKFANGKRAFRCIACEVDNALKEAGELTRVNSGPLPSTKTYFEVCCSKGHVSKRLAEQVLPQGSKCCKCGVCTMENKALVERFIDDENAIRIQRSKTSPKELAEKYGVSLSLIWKIKKKVGCYGKLTCQ